MALSKRSRNVLLSDNSLEEIVVRMSHKEERIREIISAHIELSKGYDNVVRFVESQPLRIRYRFEVPNPFHFFRSSRIPVHDKLQLLTLLAFYVTLRPLMIFNWCRFPWQRILQSGSPSSSQMTYFSIIGFRPFVKYLINSHIKRNYEKLYSLYLRELVTQKEANVKQDDIDELRNIASDIKSYAETLPSAKKMIATILAILTISATLIELFDLRQRLANAVPTEIIGSVIVMIFFIPFMAGAFLTMPLGEAFKIKRALFTKATTYFQVNDIFLGTETLLYRGSIYSLEDKLYNILGNDSAKPKEIPLDHLYTMGLAIPAVLFMGVASVIVLFIQLNLFAIGNFFVNVAGILMLLVVAMAAFDTGIQLVFGLRARRHARLL